MISDVEDDDGNGEIKSMYNRWNILIGNHIDTHVAMICLADDVFL